MTYWEWLSKDETGLYMFITLLGFGALVFIIVNIYIFIDETIEKNKKIEELEQEIKKLKGGRKSDK